MIYKFSNYSFFANNGEIILINEKTGERREIDPKEFYKRAIAVAVMFKDFGHKTEYKHVKLVQEAREAMREALAQKPRLSVVKQSLVGVQYSFRKKDSPEEVLWDGYELQVR